MYVNTFNRLFDAHTTARQWSAATRLLEQLDVLLSKKCVSGPRSCCYWHSDASLVGLTVALFVR